MADVLVEAFVDGRVRGHEEVQPERVEALVDLFTAAAERSELVALLHRHGPVVEAALAEALDREPDLQFVGPEGWEQTVWRLPGRREPCRARGARVVGALRRRRAPPRRREPERVGAARDGRQTPG